MSTTPNEDFVSAANSCPKCSENRKDFLILDDDVERLTCSTCGTNYPWTVEGVTPPALVVEVGQTWADTTEDRTLYIQVIKDGRATCSIGATGRRTKIKTERLLSEKRYTLLRLAGGKRVVLAEER